MRERLPAAEQTLTSEGEVVAANQSAAIRGAGVLLTSLVWGCEPRDNRA